MLVDQAGQHDLVFECLVDRIGLTAERGLDRVERTGSEDALARDRDSGRLWRIAFHRDDLARGEDRRRRAGIRGRRAAQAVGERLVNAAVGSGRDDGLGEEGAAGGDGGNTLQHPPTRRKGQRAKRGLKAGAAGDAHKTKVRCIKWTLIDLNQAAARNGILIRLMRREVHSDRTKVACPSI